MNNELVRYSRAGDEFHYRWAARRCLNLVHPKSNLKQILIEGSLEAKKPGEYVIDVAEYYYNGEIKYYQLKHTTVNKENPFNLSDLKDTFQGFAARFKADKTANVEYIVVTNRTINFNFKTFISKVANGNKYDSRYMNTFKNYTELTQEEMVEFCGKLKFLDYEGDYAQQKYQLQMDLSKLIPGNIDTALIENVKSLVQSRVLPDSNGIIYREDLLKLLGVTSEFDLFPAPIEFETIDRPIILKQTQLIKETLFDNYNPVIVHAAGGVGKTIFVRELSEYPSDDYIPIVYDCFGGGRYRNISESRHQHRIALTQIVNELALKQLCEPLIIYKETPEYDIVRSFRYRIKQAVKTLREVDKSKNLLLIIDAADNAEMVADERNDNCFVSDILKEENIEGLKLLATCRTERIELLSPSSTVQLIELEGFSEDETFIHLSKKYPKASKIDGIEFHRLTYGNPRVQSNALVNSKCLEEVFSGLMNMGNTVSDQINNQLRVAIDKVKDKLSAEYQQQINDICIGLATLPPFIPLEVLAQVSNVDRAALTSFASEVGKSLWILDDAIQFRDEPTETWFRESFVPEKAVIDEYILKLLPLSNNSVYVSSTIPSLLLKAEKYQDLINIALSDDYLPENALDKRNVKLYRLKFAFKASLKLNNYVDSIKLALLAGEESAGDKRQIDLLKDNIDLIKPLMQEEYVQNLAFKRLFSGNWNGSENIYSASLLSTEKKYLGESRNFLRSATNWLSLYLEELRQTSKQNDRYIRNDISNEDITEYIYTYLNLYGPSQAVNELQRWTPKIIHYEIANNIIKRLVDNESFDLITQFASEASRNPYIIIAYVDQMSNIGRDIETGLLEDSIVILCSKKSRIKKLAHHDFENHYYSALLTYLEICLKHNHSKEGISRILNYYFDGKLDYKFGEHGNLYRQYRDIMVRKFVLQQAIEGLDLENVRQLISEKYLEDDKYNRNHKIESIKSDFLLLLPWYKLRLELLIKNKELNLVEFIDLYKETQNSIEKRYRNFDVLPYEIIELIIKIIIVSGFKENEKISEILNDYIFESKFVTNNVIINLLNIAFKNDRLDFIKYNILASTIKQIDLYKFETIDEKADAYVQIARALYSKNADDAAVYFNMAIEMVSKFGDEIVDRWGSLVSLAKRAGETSEKNLPYRFIRCAEVVGENVYREKYWNRTDAILTCGNLSLPAAISALSRWRDRNVGEFDFLLSSLLTEMVVLKKLLPIYAWGLRSFLNQNSTYHLGVECINAEENVSLKQKIFDDLVEYLLINGLINEEIQEELTQLVESSSLKFNRQIYNQRTPEKKNQHIEDSTLFTDKEIDYEKLMQNQDFNSIEGIDNAIKIKQSNESIRYENREFWLFAITQITNNKVNEFLINLINSKMTSVYDICFVLSNLPREWTIKVSLKQKWGQLIRAVGVKHATHFTSEYTVEMFLRDLSVNINNNDNLMEGVIDALSSHCTLSSAEEYYGLINNLTHLLDKKDSIELLDYGINRFEMHIDDDFSKGDINYLENIEDIATNEKAITGLIISTLGSPNSEVRWRAIHSIKNISDYDLKVLLDEMLNMIDSKELNIFVDIRLPLYDYHIRQFLLIALQRISEDKSDLLLNYVTFLSEIMLKGPSHALIQRFAAKVIRNIENSFPDTFSKEVLNKAKSQFTTKEQINEANRNEIEKVLKRYSFEEKLNHYHGYDVERYWFAKLGEVFGVKEDDVTNLANFVVNEIFKNYHHKDERNNFRIYNYEETDHSYELYPKVDKYGFYISYHSMLIVASLLFENLPVVKNDWYEEPWEEWIARHALTTDNKWVFERRDPIPYLQNTWEYDESTDWLNQILSNEFVEQLISEINGEKSIIVRGFWNDSFKDKEFSVSIYSALVEKESSESLLFALNSCEDPYDFKLPDYQEDMEINFDRFRLIGWLKNEGIELKIDKNDPFSKKVPYPPIQIGDLFLKELDIQFDETYRNGESLLNPRAIIENNIWCKEDTEVKGNIMKVSLDFIELLLNKLNLNLIIEVQIRKKLNNGYLYGGDNKVEYSKPQSRVFLFSEIDGCRDSKIYYKFREKNN